MDRAQRTGEEFREDHRAPGSRNAYPIAAVPHDTAPAPTSPWVLPGDGYSVRLTVNGKTFSTKTYPDVDYSKSHFGGTGVQVLKADCTKKPPEYLTESSFKTSF